MWRFKAGTRWGRGLRDLDPESTGTSSRGVSSHSQRVHTGPGVSEARASRLGLSEEASSELYDDWLSDTRLRCDSGGLPPPEGESSGLSRALRGDRDPCPLPSGVPLPSGFGEALRLASSSLRSWFEVEPRLRGERRSSPWSRGDRRGGTRSAPGGSMPALAPIVKPSALDRGEAPRLGMIPAAAGLSPWRASRPARGSVWGPGGSREYRGRGARYRVTLGSGALYTAACTRPGGGG